MERREVYIFRCSKNGGISYVFQSLLMAGLFYPILRIFGHSTSHIAWFVVLAKFILFNLGVLFWCGGFFKHSHEKCGISGNFGKIF